MFESPSAIEWTGSLVWLAGIAAGAFLVSWLLTDRLGVRRTPYVGALAVVTGGLVAGYQLWIGVGTEFWVHNWGWGLAGAIVAGALLAFGVRRAPAAGPRTGVPGAGTVAWEAVVYGVAEGLLLSVLPVVVAWQAFSALGWTGGWASFGAGAGAMAASVLVIVVHHLGYPEYRGKLMVFPVVGCSVLSLAYLLSASPIAAIGGHIVLHLGLLRRRVELPPHAPRQSQAPSPVRPARHLAPV